MEKVLVFGHKNPDTDTIASAIAYAELKKALGVHAEAVRLGEVNGETQFALDYFKVARPRLVTEVSKEAQHVILVDHNERQQSADDIDAVKVTEVIDHHRIANFETSDPVYYRAEPVGCTTTILNKMYKEHGVAIKPEIAGLMLSAIVSDSLLFKSPTCTEQDVLAARELATIAGVDANVYGLDMLKAGADLSKKTVDELISLDAKEFSMGPFKVEIAQANTVDTAEVLLRQAELETRIEALIAEKDLDLYMLLVTDILTNNSVALVLGPEASLVERAFGLEATNHLLYLEGVVSRKKQVVPVLTNTAAAVE